MEIRLQGGLETITECLRSEDLRTKRDALRTLCNLSIDPSNKVELGDSVPYVLDCLKVCSLTVLLCWCHCGLGILCFSFSATLPYSRWQGKILGHTGRVPRSFASESFLYIIIFCVYM